MNKRSYSQILDRVARDHVVEPTDLTPRILRQIQKGKNKTMRPRTKVFAAALLILLVLVIVSISVPAVRAAIQRWIGYVPGVGLVSEGQIRVLAEPVSVTREGITLKLEQVLVDSTQTSIMYTVEGLTMDMLASKPDDPSICRERVTLRLPEEEFTYGREVSGFGRNGEGYQSQVYYPTLPAHVQEATLVIPCLPSTLIGKVPEDWELAFRLIPAPPELTTLPVIEISTPVGATGNLQKNGIFLTMDRAVQMEDGYVIFATLHAENTDFSDVSLISSSSMHLLDADRREILHYLDIDAMAAVPWEQGQTAIVIKTESIPIPGPVTLVIDSVHLSMGVDASFTFDPGPDPQPGQVWELNQEVELKNGYSLRVLRATYPRNSPQPGFSFEMESDTGVSAAFLVDTEHLLAEGPGLSGSPRSKTFQDDFYYAESMPAGPITVTISSIGAELAGPWQAQWTPPAPVPEEPVTSIPEVPACLTRESWQQALQRDASLPPGLDGTLALYDMTPPDDEHKFEVIVVRLDGSERRVVGAGSSPSLSPDGKRVIYQGPVIDGPPDGLYLADLASGDTIRLPGTTVGDLDPIWSPDSQWIAFTRSPDSGLVGAPGPHNLVLVNADDGAFLQLTEGNAANYARAWMPDGNSLLYIVDSEAGTSLRTIDVRTGETSLLFDLNSNGRVAVSPDGKRLIFEENLSPERFGMFVSDLDGSNRKMLANGYPYTVISPAWSPDGNWVIVSVHDPDQEASPTLALIQVDACQIIPLPNLSGYVSSWIP